MASEAGAIVDRRAAALGPTLTQDRTGFARVVDRSVGSWANSVESRLRCRRVIARSATADPDRDRRCGDERADGPEHEDEGDAAEANHAEPADRRPEQQPAHLGRPVQPERLAPPLGRGRVGDVAAGRRVVDRGGQTGQRSQDDERDGADDHQRQELEHARSDVAQDHERNARDPVGQPAEDRLADEARRGPRREDDAEHPEVDAVLAEVERHDGQRAPKPSQTTNSAMSNGRIGDQVESHDRTRRVARLGGVVGSSIGGLIVGATAGRRRRRIIARCRCKSTRRREQRRRRTLMGPIGLHGGGEYLPGDERFIDALLESAARGAAVRAELASAVHGADDAARSSAGARINVVILPTAAARGRADRAGATGAAAFERRAAATGVTARVEVALVVDGASADDPSFAGPPREPISSTCRVATRTSCRASSMALRRGRRFGRPGPVARSSAERAPGR